MIKGVIFDADGTLIDSMGFWTSTVYGIVEAAGVKDPDPELIDLLNPMSMYEGAVYLKNRYAIETPIEEIIAEENRRVLRFYTSQVTLCEGMGELVSWLHSRRIPMTVASATDRPLIESAMKYTGLFDKLKGIFSCGDVGHGKDTPEVFLAACRLMGTRPEETVVVEDSPTAIATAAAAGFATVDVTAGNAFDMVTALFI